MMNAMNNVLRSAIVLVIRVFVLLAITLLLFQRKLIYHPRGYSPELMAAASAKPLHYETSEGDQVAWVARESVKDVKTVWLITCGNGTCALDLVNYFEGMTEMVGMSSSSSTTPATGPAKGLHRQHRSASQSSRWSLRWPSICINRWMN